jgi:6-phosphogluconate dehydrogenase
MWEVYSMNDQCDIGLIGLAVMGQNLILNMADHGFNVAAYNRTTSKVDEFLAGPAKDKSIVGCYSPEELVQKLKRPRRIMMMVKAGDPVSQMIKQLIPLLEKGDIIIDGGNAYYKDTERHIKELEPLGILFLGTGISGGEEGARYGPSIMPGGRIYFSENCSQGRTEKRYPMLRVDRIWRGRTLCKDGSQWY